MRGVGTSPDAFGANSYEVEQMRAEWMAGCLPRTASMMGVEWDDQWQPTPTIVSESEQPKPEPPSSA